jgi:hypothetical protein
MKNQNKYNINNLLTRIQKSSKDNLSIFIHLLFVYFERHQICQTFKNQACQQNYPCI